MAESASSSLEIFASTALGLESIAAGELKALGVRGKQEVGGVAFTGDLARLYEANLWLRTASRVIVRLGRFHASTFFELERRARKLPWTGFLPAAGRVRLRVTCRKSKLYHSDAVAERVMAAIKESVSRAVAVEDGQPDDESLEGDSVVGRSQLFVVRILHDECEISADSSGELLHRRGYRVEVGKAPLRETIAAAMVLASGWKARDPLLDPMCGSGTIPIEAAMIARRIAPGLRRSFQFMDWPGFQTSKWDELLESARTSAADFSGDIIGADRDEGAIGAAKRNAERAGVATDIRFSVAPISSSIAGVRGDLGSAPAVGTESSKEDAGWILTNPPYGVRVGGAGDLRNLYATLGSAAKVNPRWRLGMLTSDSGLIRQSGLALAPRFSTSNGGIPVAFFASEKIGRSAASRRTAQVAKGVDSE